MIGRRNFLQMTVGAAAAAHVVPAAAASRRGIVGANDRIRVGLIGCGGRGNQVAKDWMKHQDSVFVAACDVYKQRLDETVARANLAIVTKTLDELTARKARLAAERDGAGEIEFPPEMLERAGNPSLANTIAGERRLFDLRRTARIDIG